MEIQDLLKMSLNELLDYNLELNEELRQLERKLQWAKEFRMIHNNSPDKSTKDKLDNSFNIISERIAKYEIMNCSKRLKKLEKKVDELETFLNSHH